MLGERDCFPATRKRVGQGPLPPRLKSSAALLQPPTLATAAARRGNEARPRPPGRAGLLRGRAAPRRQAALPPPGPRRPEALKRSAPGPEERRGTARRKLERAGPAGTCCRAARRRRSERGRFFPSNSWRAAAPGRGGTFCARGVRPRKNMVARGLAAPLGARPGSGPAALAQRYERWIPAGSRPPPRADILRRGPRGARRRAGVGAGQAPLPS